MTSTQITDFGYGIHCSHHVEDFEVSKRKGNGVGRRGYRQHEGQGGGNGAWQHHVQWMYLHCYGLKHIDVY